MKCKERETKNEIKRGRNIGKVMEKESGKVGWKEIAL